MDDEGGVVEEEEEEEEKKGRRGMTRADSRCNQEARVVDVLR